MADEVAVTSQDDRLGDCGLGKTEFGGGIENGIAN